MEYQIRIVQKKDIDQLVKLCAEHAAFEDSHYSEYGKKEMLQNLLFSNDLELKCLVVTVGENLVGYATFIRQFSTWDAKYYLYMDCLFLKEGFRRYGIGKKLLNEIKLYAIEQGYGQIQWQTPTSNKKAIEFYKREGAYSKDKVRFFFNI